MELAPRTLRDPRTETLGELKAALLAGLSRPLPYEPKPEDPRPLMARLSPAVVEQIARASKLRGEAMRAVRQDNVDLAVQKLCAATAYMDAGGCRESQLVMDQFHVSMEAYIDYRCGHYARARAGMERAIRLVNALESDFGYDFLDGRRIHLACNLARVEGYRGNKALAARLLTDLLHYVAGARHQWPYPELGSPVEDVHTDPVEGSMVFDQVARELALLHVGEEEAMDVEAELDRLADAAGTDARLETLREWVLLKRARAQEDSSAYWERAARFLRRGRIVPALWFAVVLDVAMLCREHEGPEAAGVLARIEEQVGPWEYLEQIKYAIAWRKVAAAA